MYKSMGGRTNQVNIRDNAKEWSSLGRGRNEARRPKPTTARHPSKAQRLPPTNPIGKPARYRNASHSLDAIAGGWSR